MDEPTPTGSPETSRRFCPKHVQEAAGGGLLEAGHRRLHPGAGRYRGRAYLQHDCREGFLGYLRENESADALYVPTRNAADGRLAEIELGEKVRLERFDGAGHALFVDDPEKFNRVLEEFLQSLPK